MTRKYLYYLSMMAFAYIVLLAGPTGKKHMVVTQRAGHTSDDTSAHTAGSRRSLLITEKPADSPYYLRFTLEHHAAGNINCYMPPYTLTDLNTVKLYASFFNMPDEYEEDGEAYHFATREGTLTIYKHTRQLQYKTKYKYSTDFGAATLTGAQEQPDDEFIIERAVAFMDEHLLFFTYDETRVFFDGDAYTVTFVDRIGNIKNYAFNNTLMLDRYGRVLQADYYFTKYERLGTCKIKSMQEAFMELPVDLPEDTYVSLTNCQLVYSYENSIIQPMYFFEGEASGGQSYECFVKAAIYGA